MAKRMQKGQSFVQGAFILMFANVLVKLIGALFKIPLTNMIGEQAMAYFSGAYSIFTTFFIISTAGLPVAMSRMIAAADAMGDAARVRKIFRISMWLFVALGAVGCATMILFAHPFSALCKQTELFYSLYALAPTLFFIGIISAYRGYFQGMHNMIPTAVSQTIEALGKLIAGLCLAYFAKQAFPDQPWIWAAFAILGVTIGIVFSCLYLSLAKVSANRNRAPLSDRGRARTGSVLKELVVIAIPITLAAVMINLTSNIDLFTIVPLLENQGVDRDIANTYYGTYTSTAVTLFNLVPALTQAFSISIIPAISAARARLEMKTAEQTMDSAIKIVSCIVLPATFGMIALARPIIDLLYGSDPITYVVSSGAGAGSAVTLTDAAGKALSNSDISTPLLCILAISIFLAGLYSCTGSILQACGQEKKSIVCAVVGILTKLVTACIFISIPSIGVLGAAISTTLCYAAMLFLNFFFLYKHAHYTPKIRAFFLRPFASSLLCGAVAFGLYTGLCAAALSGKIALFVSIAAAVVVYFVSLMLLGGLTREDIRMLPKGDTIAKILSRTKLLK